jgi:hypothetical protein
MTDAMKTVLHTPEKPLQKSAAEATEAATKKCLSVVKNPFETILCQVQVSVLSLPSSSRDRQNDENVPNSMNRLTGNKKPLKSQGQ